MAENRFEWDAEKAATNWRAHGVTFGQTARATGDLFSIEWADEREDYGEERVNLLGMCDGVLLHVTYTERGERIRVAA